MLSQALNYRAWTGRQWLGAILLVISTLLWITLPAVPFLPLAGSQKLAWGGGLFVAAEVTWWLAMPLLGPEVIAFGRYGLDRLKRELTGDEPVAQPAYLPFIDQTLHYFDRPHEQLPDGPILSPAAWRGADMPSLDELAYVLSPEEVAEVETAVNAATASGLPVRELTAQDFPLPLLGRRLESWRSELGSGCGFQVIRGVPVDRWTQQESELFFWCFGLHLGRPGEQNPDGDLLGHVIDTGERRDDPMVRLYKTSANIAYHCDAADVVGLLCLKKALKGGHSRIASSVAVYNELLARRPDLAPRLFEPFQLDIRDREVNEAGSSLPIPPCRYAGGRLRTFYHSDYFRSVVRHDDIPGLTPGERDLLDTYEQIAMEPGMYLDMDLQPGDVQLLSNHTMLHARTDYEDHTDPARRRHLLRLWLSLDSVSADDQNAA